VPRARSIVVQTRLHATLRHKATKLKSFAGQEYKVTPFWELKESLNIANRIHQALSIGGWKYLEHGEGGSFLLGGVAGVLVYVHPGATDQTKTAAAALVSALNDEEIISEPREQNDPANPNNIIQLNIGTKP
jgi:hypothetical protein